nr:4-hydroxyphenylpyruvate dioxygenase [Raoultella sp. NCTC 9187]
MRRCLTRRKPAHYAGLEFIEFAASPSEAKTLGQRLAQLGFQQEGLHRSKQVALWRNGAARAIVNFQPHSWADHFHQRHGVSLCAMALSVSRSAPIIARARAYGYATWQGDAGPNESPIPAVCAPDGSLIYLIEHGDDIYARDFHLQPPAAVRDDYSGIDHLALGMEADSRDNWIIFFRTVLRLYARTRTDAAGPVRSGGSLAVHSPQGNIRLALNISQSRATQIARSVACYQGAGLQHAAFACRDLPATLDSLLRSPSTRCRSRQTTTRIWWRALAPTSARRSSKRLQILYDRDGQVGEFLHLYTRPFSSGRFFFELTERRGGYALYGAAKRGRYAFRRCSTARLYQMVH